MLKLKLYALVCLFIAQPPSGGCVLKHDVGAGVDPVVASRLQAAVC